MKRLRRFLWLTLGALAMLLATLGVALPLVPTTPFILVAVYAFAQSSETYHDWLMRHRLFGKLIADWRAYGAISRRAKIASLVSMVAILALTVIADAPRTVLIFQAVVLTAAGGFVLSRPLPPPNHATAHRGETSTLREKHNAG
ncbi:MAG: YbaN family protein [Pseudomonadota bacterium]